MLSGRGLRVHCPSVYAPRAPRELRTMPTTNLSSDVLNLHALSPSTIPAFIGGPPSQRASLSSSLLGGSLLWASLKSSLGRGVSAPSCRVR